jgi:hypothetical protein
VPSEHTISPRIQRKWQRNPSRLNLGLDIHVLKHKTRVRNPALQYKITFDIRRPATRQITKNIFGNLLLGNHPLHSGNRDRRFEFRFTPLLAG